MPNKEKPVVGQRVFLRHIVGTANRFGNDGPYECVVTSVGRKYFYIKGVGPRDYYKGRFIIDGWTEDAGDGGGYNQNYECYKSLEDIENQVAICKRSNRIREGVRGYGPIPCLTLNELTTICRIFDAAKERAQKNVK